MNTSYEEVPYESKPHYPMHPDGLSTLGLLFGMQPAKASSCRVLELGCATGMNVICLAEALPNSEFVGMDLSPSQIAAGNRLVEQAGLKNVTLRAASITDVDDSWGKFDYILSHGVFSWVPEFVQEKTFAVCRQLLNPQGIAYISYNAYPGWHLRSIVRDLMRYYGNSFSDPKQRVEQARALLSFMAKSTPDASSPYSQLLAGEAEGLSHAPDSYLFHEHLEDVNQPLYFHQFVERAAKHHLQFMSEAWQHTVLDDLPEETQSALQGISQDLIQLEQFADFLTNRTFRRTLLVHHEVELDRAPKEAAIASLYVSALAEPKDAEPDVRSTEPITFQLEKGLSIKVNYPIVKAALARVYREWPRAIPFETLFAAALQDIADPAANVAEQRAILATLLLRGHLSHFVALHREPFNLQSRVTERPTANILARVLARQNHLLPTRRHKLVPLQPAERALLTLLDGSRTESELVEALLTQSSEPSAEARNAITGFVRQTLPQFARQGLLTQ
ncbi:methyltransferase regulatory domain-containing protein [Anatilimnocola floriformis]|uniref:methyltransferase regulatory domain-containing protein n=1 Tax=Anatilimnocola floriformis TaxID=2948575 RepID=UPI0020C3C0C1|nr:methyltransferase regulatory domain-containing protein [Anatilimnocola floriformis]